MGLFDVWEFELWELLILTIIIMLLTGLYINRFKLNAHRKTYKTADNKHVGSIGKT